MSDPSREPTSEDQRRPEVSDEIARSMSGVWQRHSGGRPSSVSTTISDNVVKCVMQDAVSGIEVEPTNGTDVMAGLPRSPDSNRYRNEAIAAVSRLTGRRVLGFIPKRDATTDVATETFILERVRARN